MNKLFAAFGATAVRNDKLIRISISNEPESLRRLTLAIQQYRSEVLHLAESAELSQRNIEDLVWYTLLKAGYLPDSSRKTQFAGPQKTGSRLAYVLIVQVIDAPLRMRGLIAHLNSTTS